LDKDDHFEIVGECGNGMEVVELAKRLHPDLIIMDVNLPGLSGIEATEQILRVLPSSIILGLSQHSQPRLVRRMITSGARGYVTKTSLLAELTDAIRQMITSTIYICKEIKTNLGNELITESCKYNTLESLSKTEIQVFKCLMKGSPSKEIAEALNISSKTVNAHRYNIFKKLNLKNIASLMNLVHDNPQLILK
jgi:two-component system invasion response regulator UvrY